ncbi:MAG TPA: DUF5063 domain-containing protein [Bacteroidia bacterium]|nr:DUF5063 domain-containing protein [Bacteroidia bacterium]
MISLPDYLKKYLELESTRNFLALAREYVKFCEIIIQKEDAGDILKSAQPLLTKIYAAGTQLEEVPGDFPEEWVNYENTMEEGAFDKFIDIITKPIDEYLMCRFLVEPFTTNPATHQFFVSEVFSEMYREFKDNLYRLDHQFNVNDVDVALRFMKRGFVQLWGWDCAILLAALHDPGYQNKMIVVKDAEIMSIRPSLN